MRSSAADWAASEPSPSSSSWYAQNDRSRLGGHRRVLLAQRARARVARVGVQRQPGLLTLGVDAHELGLRHEYLAADIRRRRLREAVRDHADRPEVGGDVLPRRAVAPRRALDEASTVKAQGDRQAVDLELGDIAQVGRRLGRGRWPEPAADPGIERAQLVVAERVR